jgi:CheY-like chemotaxis protein
VTHADQQPFDEAGHRPVLLIVEDDGDALDALATTLEDAGYGVLRAANGLEALARLGETDGQRCDLILLDLMMPVMNGWDFRRKQQAIPAFAATPVLLMSAGAHLATVGGELNASGCLAKPVEIDDLLEVVKRHVGVTQ